MTHALTSLVMRLAELQLSKYHIIRIDLLCSIWIFLRFGKLVDRSKIKEGELYSVLVAGGCARCAQLPSKPSADPLSFTSVTQTGVGANGGYAEYIAVDEESLVPVVMTGTLIPVPDLA